jgi:predicted DNA-binding protein
MGRPPLGNKSTNVRISEEVKDRIRELVGDKGMAQFIRDAIDAELAKREQSAKKRK